MKELMTAIQPAFAWTWQTSVHTAELVVLVVLLQKLLARWLTPRLRYGLSLLILGRLLLPIAPPSPLSLANLFAPATPAVPSQIVTPTFATSPPAISARKTVAAPSVAALSPSVAATVPSQPFKLHLDQVLALGWAFGVLTLLGFVVSRYGRWLRLIRQGRQLTDTRLIELLDRARDAMGVRRAVTLVTVPQLSSPAVFGVWRIRLLVPETVLRRLDDRELQMVLLHEMAHVRRRDGLLNVLLIVVQCLHWFNPLVWLGLHRLRADRELVCDALVMQRMRPEERPGYGRLLLKLLEHSSPAPRVFPGATPAIGSKRELKRRILLIKHHRSAGLAACVVTAGVAATLAGTTFTASEQPAPASEPAAPLPSAIAHPGLKRSAVAKNPKPSPTGQGAGQQTSDFIASWSHAGQTIDDYTGPGGQVTIPAKIDGLPVIGIWSGAFARCSNLTSVTIPDSVAHIDANAFAHCLRLTGVTIGAGVTNVGGAFAGCSNLTAFTVNSNNADYSSAAGVLFNKSGTTLIRFPSGVGGSFAIPTSVTGIGEDAFADCIGLTNISIPPSVTNIADSAFLGCTGLTHVTIPTGITRIPWGLFYGCTGLTHITIPSNVTVIDAVAFNGCTGLTHVTIPGSVTSIGMCPFRNCRMLKAIRVERDNSHYASIDGVLFDKTHTSLIEFPGGKNGEYAIPATVTNIADAAFLSCTGLTGVTIPDTVTRIGRWAFMFCAGLTRVTIPASVIWIGSEAFAHCNRLDPIAVARDNPRYLSVDGVLFNKSRTTLIQFPRVRGGSYKIPNGVTKIGIMAFMSCGSLTNIAIPDGVTSIGAEAFGYCTNLTRVTIPASVRKVEQMAFFHCTQLRSVYLQGRAPPSAPAAFTGADHVTVYYRPGKKRRYLAAVFAYPHPSVLWKQK